MQHKIWIQVGSSLAFYLSLKTMHLGVNSTSEAIYTPTFHLREGVVMILLLQDKNCQLSEYSWVYPR